MTFQGFENALNSSTFNCVGKFIEVQSPIETFQI